ncbi:hypothetical protein ACTG2V_00035 [Aeromonas sp. 74A]
MLHSADEPGEYGTILRRDTDYPIFADTEQATGHRSCGGDGESDRRGTLAEIYHFA